MWFEAWRYQHEASPIVALLHEICQQLPRHEKIKETLKKWGTVMTKGFFGAIDKLSMEIEGAPFGIGGKAGVEISNPFTKMGEAAEAWAKEHLTGRLTTNQLRELLREAIDNLLEGTEASDTGVASRICVIIDDLDRCSPATALRLLEGIKIYLSLPQCVFVLGLNSRQIEQAIATVLPGAGENDDSHEAAEQRAERHAEAAEYLEKLCSFTWELPLPRPEECSALLLAWLADPPSLKPAHATPLPTAFRDRLAAQALKFDCLPANPRKIKGLANTVRQLASVGWSSLAKPGVDLPLPEEEADAVLIAAMLYHFHPELLRFLQSSKDAWPELVKWAGGKTKLPEKSDLGKLLKTYRHPTVMDPQSQTSATPGSEPRLRMFPDPVHLNVFRIQGLLCHATDPGASPLVTYEQVRRYLSLPE